MSTKKKNSFTIFVIALAIAMMIFTGNAGAKMNVVKMDDDGVPVLKEVGPIRVIDLPEVVLPDNIIPDIPDVLDPPDFDFEIYNPNDWNKMIINQVADTDDGYWKTELALIPDNRYTGNGYEAYLHLYGKSTKHGVFRKLYSGKIKNIGDLPRHRIYIDQLWYNSHPGIERYYRSYSPLWGSPQYSWGIITWRKKAVRSCKVMISQASGCVQSFGVTPYDYASYRIYIPVPLMPEDAATPNNWSGLNLFNITDQPAHCYITVWAGETKVGYIKDATSVSDPPWEGLEMATLPHLITFHGYESFSKMLPIDWDGEVTHLEINSDRKMAGLVQTSDALIPTVMVPNTQKPLPPIALIPIWPGDLVFEERPIPGINPGDPITLPDDWRIDLGLIGIIDGDDLVIEIPGIDDDFIVDLPGINLAEIIGEANEAGEFVVDLVGVVNSLGNLVITLPGVDKAVEIPTETVKNLFDSAKGAVEDFFDRLPF